MRASILVCLLLVACSADPAPEPSEDPVAPREVVPQPPERIDEPTPELPLPEARVVRVTAEDGLELVGDLREGAAPDAPLVILVHQLSTTRNEWEPLLRRLGGPPAMATFALDMRGHGESTQRGGRDVSWQSFETEDWEKVAGDIVSALTHLREEESLAPSRVFLVGSSIGSSAVILAASREEGIDAAVALSPGRAYRGVDALTPLAELDERPLLTIASRGEPESAETASDMARIAGSGDVLLVDGDRHGVGMFEVAPESLERVVAFLRELDAR